MAETLLTGATGTLGTELHHRLRAAGHDVRAASRSPPESEGTWVELDLADGSGLDNAVSGVDTVIHAATAPTGDTEAVDIDGTNRLLAAADAAGVDHFLYVSIVGVDEIPFSYYEAKHTAENAVEESPVPSTIVRSTQFHSFLDDMLGSLFWLPLWPLPTKIQLQPVAVGEAATYIVEQADEPSGRAAPIGGPAVHTLGEILQTYRDAHGRWRPILRLPVPGETMASVRSDAAICPDQSVGTVSWEQWLEREYGSQAAESTDRRASEG